MAKTVFQVSLCVALDAIREPDIILCSVPAHVMPPIYVVSNLQLLVMFRCSDVGINQSSHVWVSMWQRQRVHSTKGIVSFYSPLLFAAVEATTTLAFVGLSTFSLRDRVSVGR